MMRRDHSQVTVGGLSSVSAGVSELCPSAFDRELPQSTEAFSVKLPRGMKTHASPRVAGELASGRGLRVPTRTYNVTVEPNGHMKKPKDAMREASRYQTDLDMDLERRKVRDEEVDELVEERFLFRRERLKRFQVGSHFPALVSPRLVPAWKLSQAGKLSMEEQEASSGSRSAREGSPRSQRLGPPPSLTKPTASHARKQQYKRPASMAAPWFVSGASGASDLICDRRPVLHTEEYDDGAHASREMRADDERLWVTETDMVPPNVSAAKVSFDSSKPQLDAHIAAMRERGRAYNEALKERYEYMRENFQRDQAAVLERQGCLSTFEMSLREKSRAHEEVSHGRDRKGFDKKESSEGLKGFAAGLIGSRSRQSTHDRGSLRPGMAQAHARSRARPSVFARTTQAAKLLHAELKGP
mmetsp:Transcript_30146/g.76196  ORF Transcript_30146/g.76196 Transcript_30146/m.76196 type:complete len:414 (-) Transcript_30146:24-1265(-)